MATALTLAQMEAIGKRADAIKAAKQRLDAAKRNLELLKKFRDQKKRGWDFGWTPRLVLDREYGREITVDIFLPYEIVEQQLADNMKRAKRELILLGGEP